ncbi:FtsX-like permease family protein, partial [Candidatus Thorarchaeota archaeon]
KTIGETLHFGNSTFRIVGIYRTGDAFEDRGAIIRLDDAQTQFDKQNKVSLFYIQLEHPSLRNVVEERVERRWPELLLSSTDTFASNMSMVSVMQVYLVGISGLAIILGGVGMMNAQLMSVMERTQEIGVLKALGWSKVRIMRMILMESVAVTLIGGVVGVGIGLVALLSLSSISPFLSDMAAQLQVQHLLRAFYVVIPVGLIGGSYPAYRASRMLPVEAFRFAGGAANTRVNRLPFGGMAVQSLWQRTSRTLLTLSAIGITVGSIMALEGVVRSMADAMGEIVTGSNAEIMIRQRDAAASALSSLDEQLANKIKVIPGVTYVSRMILSSLTLPEGGGIFMLQGYSPSEVAIRRFQPVEGSQITGNRQVMLGRVMAESMNRIVGDTVVLSGKRFKVVGIFETGVSWEEMGGVVTLRDAQNMAGKPHQVTMLAVNIEDTNQSRELSALINDRFPSIQADLNSDFLEKLPEMQYTNLLMAAITILSVFVGGLAVLNTMLMAVVERTREIGILRALGWKQLRILRMILSEAALLGILGGILGVGIAFGMTGLLGELPGIGQALDPVWTSDIFLRGGLVAILLGVLGGLIPALRATQLQPTEALRYE